MKKLKGTYCRKCGEERKEANLKKQSQMISAHRKGGIFFGWGFVCRKCAGKVKSEGK